MRLETIRVKMGYAHYSLLSTIPTENERMLRQGSPLTDTFDENSNL